EPLIIKFDSIQEDPRGSYFVDNYENDYLRINRIEDGNAIPEFIFKNRARNFEEFTQMCDYHQNNPNSHFMKKRLISLPTENGRITITGNALKIKENELITEKKFENEIEFEKELWDNFKVRLVKPVANNGYKQLGRK